MKPKEASGEEAVMVRVRLHARCERGVPRNTELGPSHSPIRMGCKVAHATFPHSGAVRRKGAVAADFSDHNCTHFAAFEPAPDSLRLYSERPYT